MKLQYFLNLTNIEIFEIYIYKIHSQLYLKQYDFHSILSFVIFLDIITMINMFYTFCKLINIIIIILDNTKIIIHFKIFTHTF